MTHTISVPASDPLLLAERLPQPAAMKYETGIIEPQVAATAL